MDELLATKKYETVFIATHLKDALESFKTRYGDKLIINDHYLNDNNNADWVDNDIDARTERENVFADVLLLSKCGHLIGGPSNIFYMALHFSPDVDFTIPDSLMVHAL